MELSIIIPAYNEEKELPQTLDAILQAVRRFENQQNGSVEIIVADNDSTDRTAKIAESYGAKVVRESRRQIACVRNCGAKAASGKIFLFCDADTRLHPNTLTQIFVLLKNEKIIGGGIPFIPDEMNRSNRFGLFLWNVISSLLKISGGTLFCRREAFETVGGFPEKYYIGEEASFQFKLKFHAFHSNQKTVLLRDCPAVTSMRKIREFGLWSYGWAVLRCAFFPWLATQKKYCALWYDVRKTAQ